MEADLTLVVIDGVAMATSGTISAQIPVALVTGCSEPDGLGACIALTLLSKGYRVIVTARRPVERLDFLVNAGCEGLELDVTDESAVRDLAIRIGDRLDVLVNNAGITGRSPILDIPLATLRELYEINVFSVISLVQVCALLLITAGQQGGRPVIFNMASTSAKIHLPWLGEYGSSKAALLALSESLRHELARWNIAVYSGVFGYIQTSMNVKALDFRSPESRSQSLYTDYDDVLLPRAVKATNKGFREGPTPQAIADLVVSRIMSGGPGGEVWGGYAWWIVKYVYPYLPLAWQDRMIQSSYPTIVVGK
ncbi:hypothetical protein P7C73_g4965, partial [Tremellales sp. Uapishka_1]